MEIGSDAYVIICVKTDPLKVIFCGFSSSGSRFVALDMVQLM